MASVPRHLDPPPIPFEVIERAAQEAHHRFCQSVEASVFDLVQKGYALDEIEMVQTSIPGGVSIVVRPRGEVSLAS